MTNYEEYLKEVLEEPKEIKKDRDRKECKVCNIVKIREFDGMFDAHNKRWVDPETKQLWNGKVCPLCHKLKMRNNQREKKKNVS